jgi:transposase-like protein
MNKTKASLALLSNAPKRRRAVKGNNKHWSQSQKIEAVLTYIATGSEVKTAAATGIPKNTLHIWRYQPWWKELQQQIQDERDDEINADISKILQKSMETVSDRLVNGDFGFNQKTGEIFRKPVNLKDAHKVTIDMIDKRNLLNGKPTSRTEKVDTNNQLDFLAKKFAEMALMSKSDLNKQMNKDEIIDVEVEDDQGN